MTSYNSCARIDDRIGVFAPQYYGNIQYYASLAQYRSAIVDLDLRYDKRFKSVHRCQIIDTRGPLTLTVPVSKKVQNTRYEMQNANRQPLTANRWSEVTVSSQAGWWADHRVSLESAYGRTPFFEFYIDRFLPFLQDQNIPITELDRGIDTVVRSILGLETKVSYSLADIEDSEKPTDDWRKNIFPPRQWEPYYQVRAQQLGFHPNLSILDLIFNLGPEAILYLCKQ